MIPSLVQNHPGSSLDQHQFIFDITCISESIHEDVKIRFGKCIEEALVLTLSDVVGEGLSRNVSLVGKAKIYT